MKLNKPLNNLRISSKMDKELIEISEKIGFRKGDLIRHLLNRSLEQLKADSLKAGGYDKLSFTLFKP